MRTTLSFSESTHGQIAGYCKHYQAHYGKKLSFSKAVETCLVPGLGLVMERLPQPGETPCQTLTRRLKLLRKRANNVVSEEDAIAIQREVLGLLDDVRASMTKALASGKKVEWEIIEAILENAQALISPILPAK